MTKININDVDVEAFVNHIENDNSAGAAKRKKALRGILACVSFQASQIDRLERLAQLDDATMRMVAKRVTTTLNVKKLRAALSAPEKDIDFDTALRCVSALENDIKGAQNATETFVTIAKFAVSVAKTFV